MDFGVNERDIFVDKQNGKNFDREQYQALRNHMLRKGDVLVIKSIDRFGRNYGEILNEWKYIVKDIGADIVVLDMPLLDTRHNKEQYTYFRKNRQEQHIREFCTDIIIKGKEPKLQQLHFGSFDYLRKS